MHLPRASHLQPTPCQRAALELDVDFGTGLSKRKETRAKAQHQIVGLKEGSTKICKDIFQVFETDVLSNPKAFTLVKHRRMGGIAVNAIGATRCNDANLGHGAGGNGGLVLLDMLNRIADLHRAGMGAQQIGCGG